MRGRTNISINKSDSGTISVNGDIIEGTVANGESISPGDFVEYGTIKSNGEVGKVLNSNFKILNDELLVGIYNNFLTLVRFLNGKFEILDIYVSFTVNAFGIDNDKIYFINSSNERCIFEIENNKFKKILSTPNSVYSYTDCLFFDDKVIFLDLINTNFNYMICRKDNLEEVQRTNYSKSLLSGAKNYCFIYNDEIYFIYHSGSSSSNGNIYIKNIQFNSNYIVSNINDLKTFSFNAKGEIKQCNVYNGKLFVLYWVSNMQYRTLSMIGLDSFSKVSEIKLLVGSSSLTISSMSLSNLFLGNNFIVASYGYLFLIKLNDNYDFSIVDQITSNIDTNCYVGVYINKFGEVLVCYNNKYEVKNIVDSKKILDEVDKNLIRPFENFYNPIGVAKIGGNSGDEIQIYIPRQ